MRGRWRAGAFIVDGSVVGTAMKGAGGEWFAYGCMSDWEDTPLGSFGTEQEAHRRVEYWVKDNFTDIPVTPTTSAEESLAERNAAAGSIKEESSKEGKS